MGSTVRLGKIDWRLNKLYFVLSYVHVNTVALKAVFNELRKYNIACIIGLGDDIWDAASRASLLKS